MGIPGSSVLSIICLLYTSFGPENLGLPSEVIRERVDEALATVGMSDYKEKGPHLLSGGQKQRVAIAGIIAMRPRYIVFDEPTAMLDPSGRQEVMQTMRKLNREEGLTVINITQMCIRDSLRLLDHRFDLYRSDYRYQ